MFKQAFRIAFIALIWKQYKTSLVSTAILLVYLYLVGSIHADYLTHASLQNEGTVGITSFVLKWLALALGVTVYAVFHLIRTKQKTTRSNKHERTAERDDTIKSTNDPFNEIRKRKKLRGPADFLINDKQTQENQNKLE